MATNRQWLLSSRPTGEPTVDDFESIEADVPTPGPREVLVETEYLSVDPYMRGRMRDAESYAEPWDVGDPMRAAVVGSVVESNHPSFEAGDSVVGDLLWAEYAVADGADLRRVDPDRGPVSTAVGVLGMPGVTAYFGMTDVVEPTAGDTVVVSGAAGAVGSVAGQIAALSGCRVVGIAGTDEKTAWLESIGFDAAVNYETEDVPSALGDHCPDGVDAYFDNVGGPITDAVWSLLNVRATVAVCGQISTYNATETPTGPRKLMRLIQSRARVEGFLVRDYEGRWDEALDRLSAWVDRGDVAYRETVVEGFERAPEAFLGLFEGANVGKQLVRVGGS
ncbi:NADP-dependent oxidoreductase [Natronomonas sp.]|uniref:NADP-dependent oxidoreductase n=1 Tax=Natronomonas sp. TaxID=2184060 RepID=UPI00260BE252|nr:NADP-dependent oxidoreductase [Natronomonas sp.]